MEEFIIERLSVLTSFYEEDPEKYVSSKLIGFDPNKRVESMNLLRELEKDGFIDILNERQVPRVKLTLKGYQKVKQHQMGQK